MAKTSIHIKACDIAGSELHNKRERPLSYIRPELSTLNESFNYTGQTLSAELKKTQHDVKTLTGRKMQKNAIPIREGVVVIKEDTTMQQLQEFCTRCQDEFGLVPLQIHIHKDEGHQGSKTWKPNLHAHIVWRMYNLQGRNVRLSQMDCARMQTILAECLNMERGKSSEKKHLDALQFKIEAETKRLESLNAKKNVKEAIFKASERLKDFVGISTNDREKNALKTENNSLKHDVARLREGIKTLQEPAEELNRLNREKNELKEQIGKLMADNLNQSAELRDIISTRDREISSLYNTIGEILLHIPPRIAESVIKILPCYDKLPQNYRNRVEIAINNSYCRTIQHGDKSITLDTRSKEAYITTQGKKINAKGIISAMEWENIDWGTLSDDKYVQLLRTGKTVVNGSVLCLVKTPIDYSAKIIDQERQKQHNNIRIK